MRIALSSRGEGVDRRTFARGLALAALLGVGPARAEAPLPAGSRIESVLDDGLIAGQRVSIRRILTDAKPDALREALFPVLSPDSTARASEPSGSWQVLSARDGDGWRTLQWRRLPDGRTEALVTRWHGPAGARGGGFEARSALPPGARVLRQVSSVDGGLKSETLVAWSADPLARLDALLHQRLLASGLQVVPTRGTSDRGIARFYRGRGREVAVTLTSHAGRSGLVLHHSEVSP